MPRTMVEKKYFEWMFDLVCEGRYAKENSYRELLLFLHDVEFVYYIPNDSNRAEDGVDLRYRFAYIFQDEIEDAERYLTGPCSVLEMMVALAIRCEEQLMVDPKIGDRTGQWFWKMIGNLGLGAMRDDRFDIDYVEDIIADFLNREYEPDGRGGLFTVRGCGCDLRDVEIWTQMCYFLDTMIM